MSNFFIENYMDKCDLYSIDQDKHVKLGHGGKRRTKKEVKRNSSRQDPAGHTRKLAQKLVNLEKKKKH